MVSPKVKDSILRHECILSSDRVTPMDYWISYLAYLGASVVSPKVKDSILRHECILSSDRVTPMDYWISYLAYFYYINFRESLDIIEEQNYIPRIIARSPYTHPETKELMTRVEEELLEYARTGSR